MLVKFFSMLPIKVLKNASRGVYSSGWLALKIEAKNLAGFLVTGLSLWLAG